MVVKFLTATIAAWVAVLPMLLLQPSTVSQTLSPQPQVSTTQMDLINAWQSWLDR